MLSTTTRYDRHEMEIRMSSTTSSAVNRGRKARYAAAATLAIAFFLSSCGSEAPARSIPAAPTSPSSTDQVPASVTDPSSDTTAAGPFTIAPIGRTGASLDDQRAVVVNSVLSSALGAGLTMDKGCVAGVVAKLSDADLALLAEALGRHDGSRPDLSAEGTDLADELNSCAQLNGDATESSSGSASAEDVCAKVDSSKIAALNDSLGVGVNGAVIGPYGPGKACRFEGDAGSRVTVTLTRNAELAAWQTEITDGDGLGDGTLRRGIGQLAAIGVGYAGAFVGTDLLEVTVFPGSDISDEVLVQALSNLVDAFPF